MPEPGADVLGRLTARPVRTDDNPEPLQTPAFERLAHWAHANVRRRCGSGAGALITLDKLDKFETESVVAELTRARGLDQDTAEHLVNDVTAPDAVERMRVALSGSSAHRATPTERRTVSTLRSRS